MKTPNRPDPLQLSKAQLETLQHPLADFKRYTHSPEFQADLETRRNQVQYFQHEFPRRLPGLTQSDLLDMYSRLWASHMFTNKLYRVQQITAANGLDELKSRLTELWNTSEPVGQRYDVFSKSISHLGPAAVTEILCYIEPSDCGIWNKQARAALGILGLDNFISPTKYRITGREYEIFNRLLASLATEVEKVGLKDVDLLMVDFFLFNVAQAEPVTEKPPTEVTAGHHEVRDMIEAIGSMLGFDTDTEVPIAHGAKVDVVWRARVGNLGAVTYVFEVQIGGSIDSLILNLQRAKSSATVQRVVAVSDEDQLHKIEQETEGLQAEFRNALAFWKISEVQQVGQNLQAAMQIIDKL